MAGEVSIARESSARTLNAEGVQRRGRPITINNGFGGTRKMQLSADTEKNEAMKAIAKKFTIDRGTSDVSVDDYVRKAEGGGYDVKVWETTGQRWSSDKPYGSIVPVKNNPDYILHMKKVGKRWQGTLTERRYYGLKDQSTKLLF